ncbi:MAG: glutamine synthetase III [Clostridia bacterium]|nr:glutamine synthetase III [Clostridia bacterium]
MSKTLTELYGSMVFDEKTMKEHLSTRAFAAWQTCVREGKTLDGEAADEIAAAMKQWATGLGATHFTHWFQPMTGATAEKHDSFIDVDESGRISLKFSGKELIKGEPDASSFPSGGLRSTFEARGYTAWDPTSFAFVKENSLYIPTIFCSFSGQALDKKMPLLRSMEVVSEQAVRVLRLFGDKETNRVICQVGSEQEYFLIDKKLYDARPDLKLTGRTLIGAPPARGQEMEDHYFGMIKTRVADFMQDLDEELWKVGVPSKTKHNEVAPSQHEMAAIYSDANTACDHNQLAMELLKKVAERHGFSCLIHEKPYSCVNGSGKHNNWSLATDTGRNLFKPGSTPSHNLQFLLFLAAFVKGVDEYQGLLRASVASSGNDHRLGAQEAPPAIISIFLGEELTGLVEAIIAGTDHQDIGKRKLKVGASVLPYIRQDNTDRNRTSPMAFTGNKFEFRMPGSSDSISGPNVVLNTIMAEELSQFADQLEQAQDFEASLAELLKKVFTEHRRIIFDGNGYDAAWIAEAEARGLLNLASTPEALPQLLDEKNESLMIRHGIYKKEEIEARYRIFVEKYVQEISIEAKTMASMLSRDVMPAVSKYAAELCARTAMKKSMGVSSSYEEKRASEISGLLTELDAAYGRLQSVIKAFPADDEEAMVYAREKAVPAMQETRAATDTLETLVDRGFWPYPTYEDLLFSER